MCYRMFRTQICVTSIARTVQGTQFQNISYTIFIVTPCMLSSCSIITPTTAHI